ncbi:hypothetical protein [Methylobacter sp.]|uniref:hypothetical protein n=1 Tax=Methylobacter sp. TaxID=2051955 RepID=UPI003DA5834A
MADLALSLGTRNDRLQAILNKLDAGTGAGKLLVYTGPRPATGAAITTQTLIGTCVLSDPAGTVANAQLTFSPISDDIAADADGEIAWVRGVDSDNNFVLDMGAGLAGSGKTVIFDTLTAKLGGIIKFLAGAFMEGNA